MDSGTSFSVLFYIQTLMYINMSCQMVLLRRGYLHTGMERHQFDTRSSCIPVCQVVIVDGTNIEGLFTYVPHTCKYIGTTTRTEISTFVNGNAMTNVTIHTLTLQVFPRTSLACACIWVCPCRFCMSEIMQE